MLDKSVEMLKALSEKLHVNRLVSQSGRKGRLRQLEPEDDLSSPSEELRSPLRVAFGLMPLAVPYGDSLPEQRILNAIYSGILFEGRNGIAEELGMSKAEFTRAVRSLRANGAIHVGPSGRYRLSFGTSNFPDTSSR